MRAKKWQLPKASRQMRAKKWRCRNLRNMRGQRNGSCRKLRSIRGQRNGDAKSFTAYAGKGMADDEAFAAYFLLNKTLHLIFLPIFAGLNKTLHLIFLPIFAGTISNPTKDENKQIFFQHLRMDTLRLCFRTGILPKRPDFRQRRVSRIYD